MSTVVESRDLRHMNDALNGGEITEQVKQEWKRATKTDDCETVRRLVKRYPQMLDLRCIDLNINNILRSCTALFYSSWRGRLQVTKCLLELGADVNIEESKHNALPLHAASARGHADIVRLLLQHQARVDAVDDNGYTALHHACYYNHPEVIEHLMSHGADHTIVNIDNNTALDWAKQRGHTAAIDALTRAINNRQNKTQANGLNQNELQELKQMIVNMQLELTEQRDARAAMQREIEILASHVTSLNQAQSDAKQRERRLEQRLRENNEQMREQSDRSATMMRAMRDRIKQETATEMRAMRESLQVENAAEMEKLKRVIENLESGQDEANAENNRLKEKVSKQGSASRRLRHKYQTLKRKRRDDKKWTATNYKRNRLRNVTAKKEHGGARHSDSSSLSSEPINSQTSSDDETVAGRRAATSRHSCDSSTDGSDEEKDKTRDTRARIKNNSALSLVSSQPISYINQENIPDAYSAFVGHEAGVGLSHSEATNTEAPSPQLHETEPSHADDPLDSLNSTQQRMEAEVLSSRYGVESPLAGQVEPSAILSAAHNIKVARAVCGSDNSESDTGNASRFVRREVRAKRDHDDGRISQNSDSSSPSDD